MFLLIAAMSLPLASGVLAAPWPPSNGFAFQWDAGNNYTVLSIKLASSIRMQGGVEKFYQLNGIYYDVTAPATPVTVSGSGLVLQDKTFVFSFNGSSGANFYDFNGTLTSNGQGFGTFRTSNDTGWGVSSGAIAITIVNPKNLPRP